MSEPLHAKSNDSARELTAFVAEHGPFVWRSLRYLGLHAADVDDAAQDVFMVVHRRLGEYEERSRPQSWLYSICTRVAKAHRRKRWARPERTWAEPPDAPQAARQLRDVEQAQALAFGLRLLEKLPSKEREVFVLFEVEQLAMTEVAAALACPLQTAYARLHKARARVQAEVARATKRGELP